MNDLPQHLNQLKGLSSMIKIGINSMFPNS